MIEFVEKAPQFAVYIALIAGICALFSRPRWLAFIISFCLLAVTAAAILPIFWALGILR